MSKVNSNDFFNNIIFSLGYIGFSYIIYTLFRINCELNIKFESTKPSKTFLYKLKCVLLDVANFIVVVITWCAIVPVVILGIDGYFKNKALVRFEQSLNKERSEELKSNYNLYENF